MGSYHCVSPKRKALGEIVNGPDDVLPDGMAGVWDGMAPAIIPSRLLPHPHLYNGIRMALATTGRVRQMGAAKAKGIERSERKRDWCGAASAEGWVQGIGLLLLEEDHVNTTHSHVLYAPHPLLLPLSLYHVYFYSMELCFSHDATAFEHTHTHANTRKF